MTQDDYKDFVLVSGILNEVTETSTLGIWEEMWHAKFRGDPREPILISVLIPSEIVEHITEFVGVPGVEFLFKKDLLEVKQGVRSTIIPYDGEKPYEKGRKDLGWTTQEMSGWEVKVIPDDFDRRMRDADGEREKQLDIVESLSNVKELVSDQNVLVMGIMGWCHGHIRLGGEYIDEPCVENKGNVWPLHKSGDDRDCWVTSSQINKRVFDVMLKGIRDDDIK